MLLLLACHSSSFRSQVIETDHTLFSSWAVNQQEVFGHYYGGTSLAVRA
ncbi:MAG: hypothetical protein ACHQAY_01835 [Hyphomicrobiales bacterium]